MPTVRVGVDATSVLDERTGVENHVLTLVDALCRFTPLDVVAFVRRRPPDEWKKFAGRMEIRALPTDSQVLATQVLLPKEAKSASLDLLYCGGKPPPALTSVPLLVGIHDAIPWVHPEFMGSRRAAIWFRSLYRAAARRGTSIATVSEFSRAAVAGALGIEAARIHVIGNALAPWFAEISLGAPPPRPACAPDGEYVLAVARADPRRGLGTLLDAWERIRDVRPGLHLVLTGKVGWKVTPLIERAARTPGVILTGEVPDGDLAGLYEHASVFVTASVYEGFGLPVLEAMTFGVPVAASDIPPHLELAAGVAEFFTAGSPKALADAVRGLLTDDGRLAAARRLGPQRAEQYSSQRLAGEFTKAAESAKSR